MASTSPASARSTDRRFRVFPLGAKNPPKPTWTKSAPYLKLASVSSPAVAGDDLVFGDGMHQDSGGVLHCINVATSQPLWQLPMPGNLIHLEGAPVVADGKVFIGGGAAGVLCVELDKATLDGKEYDLAGHREDAGGEVEGPRGQVRGGEGQEGRLRHPARRRVNCSSSLRNVSGRRARRNGTSMRR